jgi:hypothetical protein
LGFPFGLQRQRDQGLPGAIAHGGDLHSTLPHGPNRLRNPSRSPIRIIRSPANASISSVSAEGPIRTSLSAWPMGPTPLSR